MKKTFINGIIACLMLLPVFQVGCLFAQNIPQKTSLGVYLDNAPPETGVIYSIKQIVPNSTAENIGLQVGDILLEINKNRITESNILFGTLKAMKVDSSVEFKVLRANKELSISGKMQAVIPKPHSESAEIILEEVAFREGYIRSIINKPKGDGPFKTIYFLQGYPCQSVSWNNENVPFQKLINHWVDLGYAVVRVEKPGVGEFVNCDNCLSLNFDDELESFENGYKKILELPYLNNNEIILYGHSLGGTVAPYLASKYNPKGVITYGVVLKPWEDYLIDMSRHQQPILGEDYVVVENDIKIAKKLIYHLFQEGKDLSELVLNNEEKHILKNLLGVQPNGMMVGRSIKFWQTLNSHNTVEYWKNVNAKVLSLYGSSDIEALNENDAKRIAEVVNHYHPENAVFKLIENADHALITVNSQKEGIALRQSGQYGQAYMAGVNKDFLNTVDSWLAELANISSTEERKRTPSDRFYKDASYQLPAYVTDFGTMDVESADLDKDGDLDLVLAMEGQANVILYNDGKGNFDSYKHLKSKYPPMNPKLTGEDSEDIAIADFDQDGDLDILFITEDTKYHELMWNDGAGNFTPAEFDFEKKLNANALAVLDANGDNYPDIIIGNLGQNEFYLNKKDGTFENRTSEFLPENNDHTQDLKVIDIDNDGDLDLVEGAEQGGSNLYIFGKNKFTEATDKLPDLNEYETRKVVLSDVNNDGFTDIYLCNVAWNPKRNGQNILLINEKGKRFTNATESILPKANNTTLDAIFIDIDNDSKKELVTANGWGTATLQAFTQQGNSFNTNEGLIPISGSVVGIALHVADFNKDGKLDFYVGNHKETDFLLISN